VVLGYKVIYYIPIDDGMKQVLGRAGGIPASALTQNPFCAAIVPAGVGTELMVGGR
jgi:hypothetical protein